MKEIAPRVVIDPGVRHGKPVIRGTRVPVATIVAHLAAARDQEREMLEFGAVREDVPAALNYAAQILEEERVRAVG